jgi:Skp family chaperone for outer membrane proteins
MTNKNSSVSVQVQLSNFQQGLQIMKIVLKHTLAAFALAMGVTGGLLPQATMAATPTVIVVVNLEAVIGQSKVGQNLQGQLQTYGKSLQAEDKKANDAIQADAKKLEEQRVLSPGADIQKKYQALQQRDVTHQRQMRQKQQELQLGIEKAQSQIMEVLQPILADIMRRNGANIVLNQNQTIVLLTTADLDITPEVLRRLNEKLTQITLKPIPLASLQPAAPKAAAKPK